MKESAPSRMVASAKIAASDRMPKAPALSESMTSVTSRSRPPIKKRDYVRGSAHELLEPRKLAGACRTHGGYIPVNNKCEDANGDDRRRVALLGESTLSQSKPWRHEDRGGIDPDKLKA